MRADRKVYLDHPATSFPKPEEVYRAVDDFARQIGIGNDRGAYRESFAVADLFASARQGVAGLLGARPDDIVFTSGATESLNTLLLGTLDDGDHVVVSPFEHNAVERPLHYLTHSRQVRVSVLPGDIRQGVDVAALASMVTPRTRLCVINHISNVFGNVAPLADIARVLRDYPQVFLAVDGAQSVGTYPLAVMDMGIDFLAFSGHKGLLAPTGTGGFYVSPRLLAAMRPLKYGGTGIKSERHIGLDTLPHKYEVGTQNAWGIAGLAAAVAFLNRHGVAGVHRHIHDLTDKLTARLAAMPGVQIYLPTGEHHGAVSFNIADLNPADVASLLDNAFGIKVRAGLHCSPLAHRLAGTLPLGTVRVGCGLGNDEADITYFLEAIETIGTSYVAKK